MNFIQRAVLYCFRQKRRSFILLLVLTAIGTLLLDSLAIRDASGNAAAKMRTAVGGKLILEIDTEGNYAFAGEDKWGASYVYNGDYITLPIINAVSKVNGVSDYNVEDSAVAYYAAVSFQYLPTNYNINLTKYGDYGTFTACLSSERCSAFESGKYTLIDGQHITPEDSYALLISKELADYNGLSVGDTVKLYDSYLDSEGRNPIVEVKIAGIFNGTEGTATGGEILADQLQANCGFLAYNTLFDVYAPEYKNGTEYSSVTIYIKDPAEIQNVYDKIKALPEIQGKTLKLSISNDDYQVVETPLEALKDSVTTTLIIITLTSFAVVTLLLTLWIRGRKREIGILLSIGKSKGTILLQFLTEAFVVLVTALSLSILLSYFTAARVSTLLLPEIEGTALTVQVSADYLLPLCCISFFLVALSVITASWTVYRLKPKDILTKMS